MNTAEVNHHVIINPLFCCLNIDFNDTNCEVCDYSLTLHCMLLFFYR